MSLTFYLDKGASLDPAAPCLTLDGTTLSYGDVVELSHSAARTGADVVLMGAAVAYALPVPAGGDLGRLRDDLARYADAGFDDAVVVIGPGGPDPDEVRALLP
ncbi:hypothetical protein GCM10025792_49350 [Pseudonocardia tropica]